MNEFNFIEFKKNLQKDINDAKSVIAEIENIKLNYKPYYEEEEDLNNERLSDIIEQIILKIKFAYEFFGLINMDKLLENKLKKYEGKYYKLNMLSIADVLYSPVLWTLEKHLNAITSHYEIDTESEYENTNSRLLLEQFLRGTPKILSDRKIEPNNESEVRNEVYKTLIHVFPDTVREIPIAKVSKTYKPDIGVKRLKSAIEYKFADSEIEAKTVIGGIFEDIKGYEGSEDWTTFYAVIYMTDYFMTQDQVEAEFKLSKVPHNWKPIVVFGKGKRKQVKK